MPILTAPDRFNAIAANFATSEVHRSSASISMLHQLVERTDRLRVLDVACGAGHLGYSFAQRAKHLTFCDPAPAMLDIVRNRAADCPVPISVERAYAEELPFAAEDFDLVVSRLAPHHFRNPARAITEMARVTAVGGYCAVIDLESPPKRTVDELNHRLEVLHDPTHVRSYTAAEWCRFFRRTGLTLECVQGGIHESEPGVTIARWCEIAGSGAGAMAEIEELMLRLDAQTVSNLGAWHDGSTFRVPVRTVLLFAVKE